jgi:hypothetical protein
VKSAYIDGGKSELNRAPIIVRSIEARLAQQPDLADTDSGVYPIAVVLDFMEPLATQGRLVDEARELRLDPFGQPTCRFPRLQVWLLLENRITATLILPLRSLARTWQAQG